MHFRNLEDKWTSAPTPRPAVGGRSLVKRSVGTFVGMDQGGTSAAFVTSEERHRTWIELAQRAGLLRELDPVDASRSITAARPGASSREAMSMLLTAYYGATDGLMVEAMWRRQCDRIVGTGRDAPPAAVLRGIENAWPDLPRIELRDFDKALVLSCGREQVMLTRQERHRRLDGPARPAKPTRPTDIVYGVNAILDRLKEPRRFVALCPDKGTRHFVAAEQGLGESMQRWGLTAHVCTEELRLFTVRRDPPAVVRRGYA